MEVEIADPASCGTARQRNVWGAPHTQPLSHTQLASDRSQCSHVQK
jgi:hypothetical protein